MINYSYTEISDQLAADYCNMNNSFILKASPDHSSATVISGESHLQQQQQHHQNELDTVVTAAQLQQLKQGTSNKPLPTEQEQKKYNIDTTTCQFKSTTSYIYGAIITVLISKKHSNQI